MSPWHMSVWRRLRSMLACPWKVFRVKTYLSIQWSMWLAIFPGAGGCMIFQFSGYCSGNKDCRMDFCSHIINKASHTPGATLLPSNEDDGKQPEFQKHHPSHLIVRWSWNCFPLCFFGLPLSIGGILTSAQLSVHCMLFQMECCTIRWSVPTIMACVGASVSRVGEKEK